MKLKALTTAAFLLATTSLVQAAGIDDVLSALDAQGFTVTEVQTINGLIYIEAIANGVERELIYDAATGALLKDEVDGKVLSGSDDYDSHDEAEVAEAEHELEDEYENVSSDDDDHGSDDSNDHDDSHDESYDDSSDDSADSDDESYDDSSDDSADSDDEDDSDDDSDDEDET